MLSSVIKSNPIPTTHLKKQITCSCFTIVISFITLLLVGGCGSDASNKSSSGDGSLALRLQWKDGTQKSDPAPSTQIDCKDLGLATIQAKIYDENGGLVTSSIMWPCEEHRGTISQVKAGSNYTLVIIGRKTDQESDPVIIHGQRTDVAVRNNEATSVDVEVQTFVPESAGTSGSCENIIFEWDAIPGAHSYEFSISENSDMSNSSTHPTAVNSFAPQGLKDDIPYYWQVKASDAFGNLSHNSNVVNFISGGPHLVKDISSGTLGSYPDLMVVINSNLYFKAWDETGRHLWRYDGTQLKKIEFDHSIDADIYEIVEFQQDAYFNVYDKTDSEIWRVDGEKAYKIDINTNGHSKPGNLTVFDGYLYFAATDTEADTEDRELYKFSGSDWTKIDTYASGSGDPNGLTVVGQALYFAATYQSGRELFKWSGENLTQFDINPSGSSDPNILTAANNQLYFCAKDVSGVELYMYDGQAEQPTQIDVCKGDCSSMPQYLTGLDGALYFFARNEENDTDLFRYPGSGTQVVNLNINPSDNSFPYNLTNIDGTLYYSAWFDNTGNEPYYYKKPDNDIYDIQGGDGDGDPQELPGNNLISDIQRGQAGSNPSQFRGLDGRIYFVAADWPQYGTELWNFDKTTRDVNIVDICSGPCSSSPTDLTTVEFNGASTLFFSANDGLNGKELWALTSTGTPQVVDINKASGGVSPYGLTEVNGMLYFGAADGEHGTELWESDGTAKGTRMAGDTNPGGNSDPSHFTGLNHKLYFIAAPDGETKALCVYDGTTISLVDVEAEGQEMEVSDLFTSGGKLYFHRRSRQTELGGLWKYDGEKKPTKLKHRTLPDDYDVVGLTDEDGMIYFSSEDNNGDTKVYKYDGQILIQINENNATLVYNRPDNLTPAGKDLFFSAYDQSRESHLYHYNGSVLTQIKADHNGSSHPRKLTGTDGKLYFSAWDGNRRNLYIYQNGVLEKIEADPGPAAYGFKDIFEINGMLYFTVEIEVRDNETKDVQLWKSNGASQAAQKIKDLRKDLQIDTSYELHSYVELNDQIYLSFVEGQTEGFMNAPVAAEIWVTDGSDQNTLLLFEASDFVKSKFGPELLEKDGTLYYIFYDPRYGPDIWRYCP